MRLLIGVSFLLCLAALSRPSHATLCEAAAIAAERAHGLPSGLLHAIGRIESGRKDPATGRIEPWPWTIDVAGDGRQFRDRAEAIAATKAARAKGQRNIDIGCFQVSQLHHPNAFKDLDEAFDPDANAQYAARFLASLKSRLGGWPEAVAAYHSMDPARGERYRTLVYASWKGAPMSGYPPSAPTEAFGIKILTPTPGGRGSAWIDVKSELAALKSPLPKITYGKPPPSR